MSSPVSLTMPARVPPLRRMRMTVNFILPTQNEFVYGKPQLVITQIGAIRQRCEEFSDHKKTRANGPGLYNTSTIKRNYIAGAQSTCGRRDRKVCR